MFSEQDEKYLIRSLGNNKVILFLGAGFSREIKNRLEASMPTGKVLAENTWKYLGYTDPYDGTTLPEIYTAFLSCSKQNQSKIYGG